MSNLEPVLPWTISKSLCNGVSRVRKGDKDVHWLRDELLLEAEVSHTQKNVTSCYFVTVSYLYTFPNSPFRVGILKRHFGCQFKTLLS